MLALQRRHMLNMNWQLLNHMLDRLCLHMKDHDGCFKHIASALLADEGSACGKPVNVTQSVCQCYSPSILSLLHSFPQASFGTGPRNRASGHIVISTRCSVHCVDTVQKLLSWKDSLACSHLGFVYASGPVKAGRLKRQSLVDLAQGQLQSLQKKVPKVPLATRQSAVALQQRADAQPLPETAVQPDVEIRVADSVEQVSHMAPCTECSVNAAVDEVEDLGNVAWLESLPVSDAIGGIIEASVVSTPNSQEASAAIMEGADSSEIMPVVSKGQLTAFKDTSAPEGGSPSALMLLDVNVTGTGLVSGDKRAVTGETAFVQPSAALGGHTQGVSKALEAASAEKKPLLAISSNGSGGVGHILAHRPSSAPGARIAGEPGIEAETRLDLVEKAVSTSPGYCNVECWQDSIELVIRQYQSCEIADVIP